MKPAWPTPSPSTRPCSSPIDRGASVRLVGDDQQLAAIGAGGVLRDIKHTHGALQLTELHRFTNPAEAAASLALRDGKPTALNFYLENGRIHVGDVVTTTEDASTLGFSIDRPDLTPSCSPPTRDLVAELNAVPGRIVSITPPRDLRCLWPTATRPSVGDVIITRANDRRLRLTATDWVKNGDRWTLTQHRPAR
jgi:hypothetical protein